MKLPVETSVGRDAVLRWTLRLGKETAEGDMIEIYKIAQ